MNSQARTARTKCCLPTALRAQKRLSVSQNSLLLPQEHLGFESAALGQTAGTLTEPCLGFQESPTWAPTCP